jgi:hypothetical protein
MADLEHVDRHQQATLQQQGLDRRLGVAGQQRPKATMGEQRHHRCVVDVTLGEWRIGIGR